MDSNAVEREYAEELVNRRWRAIAVALAVVTSIGWGASRLLLQDALRGQDDVVRAYFAGYTLGPVGLTLIAVLIAAALPGRNWTRVLVVYAIAMAVTISTTVSASFQVATKAAERHRQLEERTREYQLQQNAKQIEEDIDRSVEAIDADDFDQLVEAMESVSETAQHSARLRQGDPQALEAAQFAREAARLLKQKVELVHAVESRDPFGPEALATREEVARSLAMVRELHQLAKRTNQLVRPSGPPFDGVEEAEWKAFQATGKQVRQLEIEHTEATAALLELLHAHWGKWQLREGEIIFAGEQTLQRFRTLNERQATLEREYAAARARAIEQIRAMQAAGATE